MPSVLLIQFCVIVLMGLCALGYRFTWLPFGPAFVSFLLLGLLLSIGGILAISPVLSSASSANLVQLVLGLLPVLFFLIFVGPSGLRVPPIHDVATRHEPPLVFTNALALRKANENGLEPPDQLTINKQLAFYTDLKPKLLKLEPGSCFSAVERTVAGLGWKITSTNPDELWLEAYETTPLFGFRDDVRVELSETLNSQCQIDVRSVSRVGVSDLGANAKRIQRFFEALETEH